MVQAQVRGHGSQPASCRRVAPQPFESFERFQEDGLGHILGLGLISQQPHGDAEDPVLVFANERFKSAGVVHNALAIAIPSS